MRSDNKHALVGDLKWYETLIKIYKR